MRALKIYTQNSQVYQFSSVHFSHSVVSDSLRPHELQHARPPCSSPSPGVHSDSRPSSPWCHPAISSSVVSFSSCPQSLNESTLRMRWPKYRSFSFSIIPSKEIQGLISFRKGRGTRDQIANIVGSWKKQESSRKTSISTLLTMPKPLTVWITINCGNFWKMEIPNHLTCLLRNLYAGQEATVRTGHGKMDWFKIGKGVHQGCLLSLFCLNFYAGYIMGNAGLRWITSWNSR